MKTGVKVFIYGIITAITMIAMMLLIVLYVAGEEIAYHWQITVLTFVVYLLSWHGLNELLSIKK